ncbi:MAG: hypothetical protein ACYDD0_05590 [Candidatus Dormibacteria bacterium]
MAQLDLALMLTGFYIEVFAGTFRGRAIHDGGGWAQLERTILSAQ